MEIPEWLYIDVILVLVFLLIIVYIYLDNKYNYWARKNVISPPLESIIFGHVKHIYYGKKNLGLYHKELYEKYHDAPYVGYYEFQNPVLLIRDIQLIQTILVEKYNCFRDNKFYISEKNDLLFGMNPFVTRGPSWKERRSEMTPGFTQNKLRVLADIIKSKYSEITAFIDKNGQCLELYDFSSRFTTDTTSAWGLGLEAKAFQDESPIREIYKTINLSAAYSMSSVVLNPLMAYVLKMRVIPKELEKFFLNIIKQSIGLGSKGIKNSLIGTILASREKANKATANDKLVTELTAHYATFYLDSYETTARTLSYVLHYLLMYPDVQKRLREEVLSITEITVDAVNGVEYLDMVISEVLRRHPTVNYLGRHCTEKCKIGDLEILPGQDIIIPSLGLHFDPKYYPDPQKFNPENFNEENKKNRPKYADLSFGQGPRICIGMKYALADIKIILCYLLKDYEIIPPDNEECKPIVHDPSSVFMYIPENNLNAQFKKIR